MTARPRALLLLVAATVLGLLAGCVNPPSSGPIRAGLAGPVADIPDPLVRPIANPPRPGMSPEEVVAGFLDATAAVSDDFAVARQYLAPQAAVDWDPGAGVTVTANDSLSLTGTGGTVTATYRALGSLSRSGVYQDSEPAAASADFAMQQVDGQWRIGSAPSGLLMAREDFARAFTARSAYFIDPTGRWAVPDLRLVPRTGPQALATALVTALLAGPSAWLGDSVATAIPEGLQLVLGAVPVADGVARVELSGPEPAMGEESGQRFGAQLAWTLRQVPDVESFEVFLGGRRLPLADARGPVRLDAYDRYDPDVVTGAATLYGVTPQGEPASATDGEVRVLAGEEGPDDDPVPLAAIAVAPAGRLLAGATADRAGVVVGTPNRPRGSMQRIDVPIADGPAIDGADRVWWTDPSGRVYVAVADAAGRYREAVVPTDGPGDVLQVRPARDGTRMALVARAGESARAYLAAVVPQEGRLVLRGARPIGPEAGVVGISWHDAEELTLLLPKGEVVERTDLSGATVGAFAVPATARTLTDAPGAPLVLGLQDGTVGRLTGSGIRAIDGLRAPAYPG